MRSSSAVVDGSLIERVRAGQLPDPAARRHIRVAAGVTLRDVADELGVTSMTVLRWEQGRTVPRLDRAIAYRQLLDGLRGIRA